MGAEKNQECYCSYIQHQQFLCLWFVQYSVCDFDFPPPLCVLKCPIFSLWQRQQRSWELSSWGYITRCSTYPIINKVFLKKTFVTLSRVAEADQCRHIFGTPPKLLPGSPDPGTVPDPGMYSTRYPGMYSTRSRYSTWSRCRMEHIKAFLVVLTQFCCPAILTHWASYRTWRQVIKLWQLWAWGWNQIN